MIIQFRFENFRSFRQSALIRLQATGSKSHPHHLAALPCGQILKNLAIYGPNASGKSQLINAFRCYHAIVSWQLPAFSHLDRDETILSIPPLSSLLPEILSPGSGAPVSFSMQFYSRGHIFEYGFSFENALPEEEFLLADGKLMYRKEKEKLYIGKVFHLKPSQTPPMVSNGFFLGSFISHSPAEYTELTRAFLSFFREDFLFFDNNCLFQPGTSPSPGSLLIQKALKQAEARTFILKHLHAMGLSLPEGSPSLPLSSTGLSKLVLLLYRFFCLSRTGGVLLADDLTAFLHHNASLYFLRLFQSVQDPPIQLIFTTHDISFLNRDQFRRDEVAMVCLDSAGSSRLRTLADLRVRSDANFSSEYLEGKYGKIPAWEEEPSDEERSF